MAAAKRKAKSEQSATLSSEEKNIPKDDIFDSGGELVVDVFETGEHFVVLATIAGVQIKDLDISVEKDMMVIKGDRKHPHSVEEKNFFYQECYFGPFSRKIVLPENVHSEKALAEMDKGILTVKIPKKSAQAKEPVQEG
jgi:HSP20 family protein